jgi:hypothetical protein
MGARASSQDNTSSENPRVTLKHRRSDLLNEGAVSSR